MGRTLEQILQTEKPAVVVDAKAKAQAILDSLEIPGHATKESPASGPGDAAKSAPRDEG